MQSSIHIPAGRLSQYVNSIWEIKAGENITETILPQGIVEIIFNFTEKVEGYLPYASQTITAPRCFIQGLNTHVTTVKYSGEQHLLGVRLKIDKVRSVLGIAPSELMNSSCDMSLLNPSFHSAWVQLAEAVSFKDKINILENCLPEFDRKSCDRSEALCNFFEGHDVRIFSSVDKLAKNICFSTRQLNRVSQSLFGISAEELGLYKKFLNSVNLMHQEKQSLTGIAYESGFYDQAHFCRTFKSYTGMTAGEYRKNRSELPFHLFV
jgi:AraC-like DNA-binding protein